jgi:SAM-dependent methyltransferase
MRSTTMDKEIDTFLRKLSIGAITIASLTLIILFLQTPDTCVPPEAPSKPHLRFPKSSCDFTSTRPHLPSDKKNNRLWSSRDWNTKLHSFSLIFLPIRDLGLLHNNSKILCLSAGAGHEVAALQRLGVDDVTGVELFDSPPLVSRADPHNLPFFDDAFDFAFTARFDEALFPARFAAEMERVVRDGGVCFVLVGECGAYEVKEIVRLFRNSRFVSSSNINLIGIRMTSILMRTTKSSS